MKLATNKTIKSDALIKSINSGEMNLIIYFGNYLINYLFWVYLGMYRGSLGFPYITGMADAPPRLADEFPKNRSSKQQHA